MTRYIPRQTLKIALYGVFLVLLVLPYTTHAYFGEYLDIRAPWLFTGGTGLQGYYDNDLSNGFCHSTSTVSANDTYVFDISMKTQYTNWIDLIENPNYILAYPNGAVVPSMQDIASTTGVGNYIIISMLSNGCDGYPYPNDLYGYSSAPNGTAVAWSQYHVTISGAITVDNPTGYIPPVDTTPTGDELMRGVYLRIYKPEYGTTTGNMVNVKIKYSTPVTLDTRPTTTRMYVIRDAVSLVEQYRYTQIIPANASENITIDQNIYLSNGSKILYAYYEYNGQIYSEKVETFFNVNVNTYLQATGLETPLSVPVESQNELVCDTLDIACQLQKAIMFLFYPSENILKKFSNTWQIISTKKPFGYVTVTIDALKGLDTNGTAVFDVGEIPFMDTIFTPFKIAVGSILWAIYVIYLYQRRLKTLDI